MPPRALTYMKRAPLCLINVQKIDQFYGETRWVVGGLKQGVFGHFSSNRTPPQAGLLSLHNP